MNNEILLYTAIQDGDAERFRQQLAAAGKSPTVRVNSPGGSVFEGIAIANAITAHGKVHVVIDGLAASIASLIAIAGRRVEMSANALLMIHQPWLAQASGTADALRRDATALDKAADAMLGAYVARTGRPADEIRSAMAAETWFTAPEALAFGLVDAVIDALPLAASIDLSGFHNIPERIRAMTETITPQTAADTAAELRAALIERNTDIKQRFDGFAKGYPGRVEQIQPVYAAALANLDWTPQQFSDTVLKEFEKTPDEPIGAGYTTRPWETGRNQHHGQFRAAAVDALLLRGQVAVHNPHPAARDIQGMSLVQIAETFLSHQGHTSGGSPLGTIRAAMTTSDFPYLLSDTAAKALMRGYEFEPASHRIWTRETFARDFKPQSRVALSEAPELLEKGEGSEYQDGRLHDIKRAPNFQLVTYGRILSISRNALVNDDLQAITRLPEAFGASAARKEADVIYGMLIDNPEMLDGNPLFSAAHGNLAVAAGVLNVSTLSAARTSMRRQKGPNGGYLNPVPKYLIVPAELETDALQLVAAEKIETTPSADQTRTAIAPGLRWVQELVVVVDPRLDDDSPGGWYLAASHDQIDTCERVFLEGQRGVFTEEEQDFSTDAFRLKARLDFAATYPDWVGLHKVPLS